MERAKVYFGKKAQWKISGSKYASDRKSLLLEVAEKELASVVKMLSQSGFPLSKKDIKQLAFCFAKANSI